MASFAQAASFFENTLLRYRDTETPARSPHLAGHMESARHHQA